MTETTLAPVRARPSRHALLRIGGVLIGLTLVGACQTPTARRASPRYETAFSALPSTGNRPLVSLPNSGGVTSVNETQSSAGLRQRILLGQSRGRIDLTIASGRTWDDPAMAKPSRAGIAAELASLEDGPYRILRRPVHNAYGPLGVALSDRCAYAWQWIDGLERVELGRGALRGPVAASLRVLHCRASSNPEALVADLVRIRLGATSEGTVGFERRPLPGPKRRTPQPVEAAAAVVPAAPVPSSPGVAVNGSRTLVTVPQEPPTQPFLAPPAPAATEPAMPTIPRPAANGGSPDRPRFLTDALPSSRSGPGSTDPAPSPAGAVPRAGGVPRPPQGW